MRRSIFLLLLLWLSTSCTVFRSRDTRSALKIKHLVSHSAVFSHSFTGFNLLDPQSGKLLVDYNGAHYFTPASNTKIFTLATCLQVLKDSVPGFQMIQTEDKLIFRGTGDPTFLHPKFQYWQSGRDTLLAKSTGQIYYWPRPFPSQRFGKGWAWDDYNESFQPERSEMPIYGNCVQIRKNGLDSLQVEPSYFRNQVHVLWGIDGASLKEVRRLEQENWWGIGGVHKTPDQFYPFRTSDFEMILSDTLHREVENISYTEHPYHKIYPVQLIYSTPMDTVLCRMMHQSDNFIAEQMLLVCAGVKFDRLEQDTMIQWMLDTAFTQLPQRPRWVDGSGLSRYNLASPQSIVQVLQGLWNNYPHARVLSFFPAGGVNGTLHDWYAGKLGKPYVWAKTGSMGGIHCLSGYVQCKSGKVLIFSFMHNNFTGSNRPWKIEMQGILEQIRDRF